MKYTFNLIFSIFLVLISLPLIIVITFLIWFDLGSPIFFHQKRPGLLGKPFNMLKFRTMTNVTDSKGNLIPDNQRLTKLGRFIRSTSMDELPALLNVIKGDMNLVGPRPLLMEYIALYSPNQMRRHDVKPGITGWAQVNGRNSISWEERFKLDVWYVDNKSFWLDLKILFLTVKKVFVREGISAEGEATMPKFTGSDT